MADLGAIGYYRPGSHRKATDTITTASGNRYATHPGTRRRITDYQSQASARSLLGLPAVRYWKQTHNTYYPANSWTYPCVMGEQRGPIYWKQGANARFRIAEADESPTTGSGWKWIRSGTCRLRWSVTSGLNTLTLSIIQTSAAQPRATLRVLANASIGIQETSVSAGPATNTPQTLALEITPAAAGIVTLQLEWLAFVEREHVIWENLVVR